MRFRREHVADSVVKRIFTVASAIRRGASPPQISKPDVSKLVKVAGGESQPGPADTPVETGQPVTGMPAAPNATVSDTLEQGPLGAIMEQDQ